VTAEFNNPSKIEYNIVIFCLTSPCHLALNLAKPNRGVKNRYSIDAIRKGSLHESLEAAAKTQQKTHQL